MDNDQITALAREYAEEQGKRDREQGFPESFIKDRLEYNEKELKSVLDFLLRRFCLVEKSKVKKIKQLYGSGEVFELIDMIFPEIAKEVEG